MFGKKKIQCPAGQWTTIIDTVFAQMPVSWNVNLKVVGGEGDAGSAAGNEISGEFEEKKSSWIFPGDRIGGPLREHLIFNRGYWNTFYSVRIRPEQTVEVDIG